MANDFQILAIRCFEGTITPEEEKVLFAYIEGSAERRAEFRRMEAEWEQGHEAAPDVQAAWERLYAGILMSGEPAPARMVSLRRIRVAAVAAAALLLVAIGATLHFAPGRQQEMFYSCAVPLGSKSEVMLPDGSRVWLNAGSSLRYSNLFNKENRRVEIDGEGYFEVAKQNGAEFTVSTKGYDVIVKGTKFNVSAYKEDRLITTTLIEGSVEISSGGNSMMMKPSEMVSMDMLSGKLSKRTTRCKASAWVGGGAEYDDISLDEFSKVLSRKYALNVTVASPRLQRERFSISLRNHEEFDDVVKALDRVVPIQVVRKGKNVTISHK